MFLSGPRRRFPPRADLGADGEDVFGERGLFFGYVLYGFAVKGRTLKRQHLCVRMKRRHFFSFLCLRLYFKKKTRKSVGFRLNSKREWIINVPTPPQKKAVLAERMKRCCESMSQGL